MRGGHHLNGAGELGMTVNSELQRVVGGDSAVEDGIGGAQCQVVGRDDGIAVGPDRSRVAERRG